MLVEMSQIHTLGVFKPLEYESGNYPMNDEVYKSIFRKFSTLLLGCEMTLMGKLKCQEFIFKHENLLE